MKNIYLLLFALLAILSSGCEKEEIKPPNPNPKENLRECRKCDGTWDVTDPKDEDVEVPAQ